MNKELIWPLVLQLLAVVVIIMEFILPTAGLLGVVAFGLIGYSLYIVFSDVSTAAGMTLVIIDVLTLPVLIIIGIKMLAASPVTLKDSIDKNSGGVSEPAEWASLKGKDGTALTDLRPAGTVLIEGKRYDVVSRGEYIEKGTTIEVAMVDSNRVVVRKKAAQQDA